MLLAALSTGHKLGLGLMGAAFVAFALISAFLIPAFRPDYPTRRGLPAFLTVSGALFVAMMFAVFFFGREPSEGHAAAGSTTTAAQPAPPPPPSPTTTSTEATTTSSSAPATTSAAPKNVPVSEKEFVIQLPSTSLTARSYTFDVTNKGAIGHDLAVDGPGVNNEKTPLIGPGKTAKLTVDLKSGTYKFYCSVPGHEQAGMKVEVKVS